MHKYLIYMASGSGSRFGRNKLLEPFKGKPLFDWGLQVLTEVMAQVPDCSILVVSRYGEIRDYARIRGIRAVDSPQSVLGLSYTVRAGIRAIEDLQKEDYLLFAVADQPGLDASSLKKLLMLADGKTETARLSVDGIPGNPVLFSAALLPELLELRGDQGGGAVVKNHSCILVPAEKEALLDLDTREDLQKFQ